MRNFALFSILAVLVAISGVDAYKRTRAFPCNKICLSFMEGLNTAVTCDDDDTGCYCGQDILLESYALCLDVCDAQDRAKAWSMVVKTCKKGGVTVNGTLAEYHALAEEDYVDQKSVNKTDIVTTAVKPTYSKIRANILTRAEKNHNLQWAEYFGNILNAYWGFFIIIAAVRRLLLLTYPKKGSSPNGFISKFRKFFILPATFGGKHIQPASIGKFPLWTVPIRWQSIVVFFYFALTVIFMFVWMWTVPNNTTYYTDAIMTARNIGDRTSVMSQPMIPLLFLFAGRNNFMQWITGWSFETFNVFHRAMGRMFFIVCAVHGISYSFCYHRLGEASGKMSNALYWKTNVLEDFDDMLGLVALPLLSAIIFQSFYVFRHNLYEIFLLLHIALVLCFFGTAWHHVRPHGYIEYYFCAIGVWALDRLIRIIRICLAGPFAKASVRIHGDAFYLTVKPSVHFHPKPGQYAFVYVMRHNFWESHPFSIVESKAGEYVFVAKAHAGMTQRLHRSVSKSDSGYDNVHVWIEGPYGESFPVFKYDTVVLVAGGIGITAMMSYALDLHRRDTQQHVILYWMVRDMVSLRWMKDQMDELTDHSQVDIRLFVTGESPEVVTEKKAVSGTESDSAGSVSGDSSSKEGMPKLGGLNIKYNERPDIEAVVSQICSEASGSVAVVSCGPGSLADSCRAAVVSNVDRAPGRVDYFEDAFGWA
ncbi:ferric reductase NAD binding domain-containing protein [Lipomyces oligophaga]|uniref:ferric reductase NAD binding domain-containing protein n=1 Tax=Lipomyces oligophaga TaxID=45792 RepID=UPI0034CFBE56